MYQIHTTPGFIIDSRAYGEAGKIFSMFTRELGLVLVTAQGIRLEKSKLRYHAVEYSFGIFSLVRGKDFWRLTSAQRHEEGLTGCGELISKIALVLKRLLHGEETHFELFDIVESVGRFLNASPGISNGRMQTLESLVMLRILSEMGYVGGDPVFDKHLCSDALSMNLIDELADKRMLMNQHINKALRESHL